MPQLSLIVPCALLLFYVPNIIIEAAIAENRQPLENYLYNPPYPFFDQIIEQQEQLRLRQALARRSAEALKSQKKGGFEIENPSYRMLKHFPYPSIFDPAETPQHEPEIRHGWRLMIKPMPLNNAKLLVKRIDESLNLTCVAEYVGGSKNVTNKTETDLQEESADLGEDQVFRLAWYLPIMPQNSKNRVSFQDFHNSKHLIVDHLKESDAGEYECTATAIVDSDKVGVIHPFVESMQIVVKPKKGSCNEPMVLCGSGECIGKRFICDGRPDCKDKSDESVDSCGTHSPCEGKLRCPDGRCISPYWCCDRTIDRNCTILVQSPCCAQLKHIPPYLFETQYGPQPHNYELSFLQTTIYTVIGCSMAFMFIITIMVVAICRVHLRRTALQMNSSSLRSTMGSGPPFGDFFFNSGPAGMPYATTASGLLVTYNINNGVQFMGRPMNPPPYMEQPGLPPREGPPPPYKSVENLVEDGLPSYHSENGRVSDPPSPSSRANSPSNSEPNSGQNFIAESNPEPGPSTRHGNTLQMTQVSNESEPVDGVEQPLENASSRSRNSPENLAKERGSRSRSSSRNDNTHQTSKEEESAEVQEPLLSNPRNEN